MKICVLTHTFPRYKADATAAFMHPFVLSLLRLGNDVTVLVPYNVELQTSDFSYRVISYKYIWPTFLHRLGYSNTLSKGTSFRFETYILAPFLYLFGFFALLKLLRREKFDMVSAHWILPNGFIVYLTSLFIRIPFVVTLAGSDVFVANKNFLFSFMARLAAKKAAAICADSPQYITELKKTGAIIKKSKVIPYPVDMSGLKVQNKLLNQLKKDFGIGKETVVILGVGRLITKKGFKYLLEAYQLILKKHKNTLLLIAGDGDLRIQLEKLAVKMHIEKNTYFLGNVERDKIAAYYCIADIFVMPSIKDSEGNIDDRPVALLEAVSAGLPVIATQFPGNALSVEHLKSGFLVSQKNSKILSERIAELVISKELRMQMGRRAKTIAESSFTIKTIGGKYNALFQGVIRV